MMNILLVDDDTEFVNGTAESLRDEGHLVCVARDGESAIARARDLRPDVVLLDLGFPSASSREVARALRGHLPNATPIIVVTAWSENQAANDDVDAANDAVDLMLTRPLPHDLFGGLIEYMRRLRRREVKRVDGG